MADLRVHARRGLERARLTDDQAEAALARRQGAEKAWGYVVEQTHIVASVPVRGPSAHHLRKDILLALDRAAGTSLLRDCEEFEHRLHGACLHDGHMRQVDLDRSSARAAEFPERLRAALRRVSAS